LASEPDHSTQQRSNGPEGLAAGKREAAELKVFQFLLKKTKKNWSRFGKKE
jgi:hypothetical protein